MRFPGVVVCVLCIAAAIGMLPLRGLSVSAGQANASTDKEWRRPRASGAPTVRVDSNLVLVSVSVTDLKNRLVTGLRPEDFRVFDQGGEHQITHFAEEDVPLSVGIVFDMSGSMKAKLAEAREAVAAFGATANPEDEFFLVRFSSQAELKVPFSATWQEIQASAWSFQPSGKTALFDAIALGVNYMKRARNPRKALLVVSDGGDNHSRYTSAEIREMLREADLAIYAIGTYGSAVQWLPEEEPGGAALLTLIADESGGRAFTAQKASEIPEFAEEIGRELHNKYVLGFSVAGARRDGRYHRVQVKLKNGRNRRVYFRPGYYSPQ